MTRQRHIRRTLRPILVAFAALAVLSVVAYAWAQPSGTDTAPATSTTATEPAARTPATVYGAWATAPAVVAIVLAIVTRQVILSLGIAILVAAWMFVPWVQPGANPWNPVPAITLATNGYLINAALANTENIHVLLFTLLIGGMVGIIAANGGTQALVAKAHRLASTPERGQLVGLLAGILIFFDDYANAMIVGPTMRQITDRLRVSREKLSYIVDSTSAPVASLMIGTWFGAEISYIQKGLDKVATGGAVPAYLLDSGGNVVSGMRAYFLSWPYRFYPILALIFVFLVAWRGRDFGPMLTAERKARAGAPPNAPLRQMATHALESEPGGRAWYAIVPVLVLINVSVLLLIVTGVNKAVTGGADWAAGGFTDRVRLIADNADSYGSILYGALSALLVATVISSMTRRLTFQRINDAMITGMTRVFPALVILTCAWALAQGMSDLQLAQVAETYLRTSKFDVHFLPFAVFLISAGVSFATGSSWSTMAIICPIVVEVGAGLTTGMAAGPARDLFYAAVGSVLAGSVFGDHCSPISDTTVLSSLASECDHVAHVWTQIPYAVVVAIVGTLCGDFLCSEMDWHPIVGIAIGAVVLLVFLQVAGRRVGSQPAT